MSERPPLELAEQGGTGGDGRGRAGTGGDRWGPAGTGGDQRGPGGTGGDRRGPAGTGGDRGDRRGPGGAGYGWVVYLPPHRVRNQVEDFAQSGINSGGAELLSTVSIHTEGSRHALMGLSRALFQV